MAAAAFQYQNLKPLIYFPVEVIWVALQPADYFYRAWKGLLFPGSLVRLRSLEPRQTVSCPSCLFDKWNLKLQGFCHFQFVYKPILACKAPDHRFLVWSDTFEDRGKIWALIDPGSLGREYLQLPMLSCICIVCSLSLVNCIDTTFLWNFYFFRAWSTRLKVPTINFINR